MRVNVGFSDFNSEIVCHEDSPQFDFVEFKVDREKEVLLVFIQEKARELRQKLYIKILSLVDQE